MRLSSLARARVRACNRACAAAAGSEHVQQLDLELRGVCKCTKYLGRAVVKRESFARNSKRASHWDALGPSPYAQIPSETRSKPHTWRTQTKPMEWGLGELVVEFANALRRSL